MEALGPAFVKLGQAAATREDILSDAVAAELRKLCDQVAPFPDQEAMALICSELGRRAPANIGSVVAAASLGQVYRVTVEGREYAMKVQRPGLVKAIATDVIILKGVAKFMRLVLRRLCATAVDPVDVVEAWALTMWDELNYELEARSMEDMRKALSTKVRGLVIPQVNWQLTAKRVLTAEWINGVKVTDDPKVVRQEHIKVGVETFAAMVLDVGVVHADPHPGNMIITDGGRKLCLLDFGMVIKVPPSHREAWARCMVKLVMKEHEEVLNALIDIGFFPQDCPRDEILPVMSKIWSQLVDCGSDIEKRKAAVILLEKELLILVRRFRFGLPDYYVALARAFVTLEGIALASGCDFDIFQAIFPVCLRFLATAGASAAAAEARRSGKALLQGLCTRHAAALAAAGALVGVLVWTQIAQQSA